MTLEESEEEEELSDEDVVERGENGEILLNMPEIIEIDEHEEADILGGLIRDWDGDGC